MAITIVGLGPGPYRTLTLEAVETLHAARMLYLRTRVHPTVDELPSTLRWTAFDDLYETAPSFDALYDRIAAILLERAAECDVVYAVPGHPLIGEASVRRLLERAPAAGVATRVIGGVSFAEAALIAGDVPGVDHLQVVDALALPAITPTVPLLAHQVYKSTVASDLKLALLRLYPPEHPVVVIRAAATASEAAGRVELAALDRGLAFDHLTCVYVPPLAPGEDYGTMPGLAHIVARLRRPGGCPWDGQQTHESLKRYLVEEAYEATEAIEEADDAGLCDELGDLLLQVALHAEMADERGAFDLTDVIHAICGKLVRRHPHVFGTRIVADAAEVELNWEEIKRRERERLHGEAEAPPSLLDGAPRHHPALMTAQELVKRAAAAGLDRAGDDALVGEARAALAVLAAAAEPDARAAALGHALFALAHLAGRERLDAEDALRQANQRFMARLRALEATWRASGRGTDATTAGETVALWGAVGAPEAV